MGISLLQFTRRNAGPIQFEAHVAGAVVRSEPKVEHILRGNDVAAFWEIGSTESSNYVRSRRPSIVDLQPIESTFMRMLQIEFGERDCNRIEIKLNPKIFGFQIQTIEHQRCIRPDEPSAMRIVRVIIGQWILEDARGRINRSAALTNGVLAVGAAMRRWTRALKANGIHCGTHTRSTITAWVIRAWVGVR